MTLPQVIVRRGDRGAAPIAPDDVSTYFDVVTADRGPVGVAVECRSIGQVRQVFGDHSTTSSLRAVESYFAEGGSRAVLSRTVGPAAGFATFELRNAEGATVGVLRAIGQGAWYNRLGINLDVVRGVAEVQLALDDELIAAGDCTTTDELAELVASTGHLTLTSPNQEAWPPAEVDQRSLAGGSDDHANAADGVARALATFEEDLGAGTVCASGFSTATVHGQLADHAAAFNRFARGDLSATSTASLASYASGMRAHPNARFLQLLAGRPTIVVGGVEIDVPASGVLCGREARADRENGAGPGQPCAQSFGELVTPVGVAHTWSKADREVLNDAGITVIVQDSRGAVFAEDAITVVEPARYPQYAEVSAMRVTMAIHAQAKQALKRRLLQTIDGQGHVTAMTTGDLSAICADWYARDALYGATAEEAYRVSVAAETPAAGRARLVGYLSLRPSPSAQTVELTITQVAARDTI